MKQVAESWEGEGNKWRRQRQIKGTGGCSPLFPQWYGNERTAGRPLAGKLKALPRWVLGEAGAMVQIRRRFPWPTALRACISGKQQWVLSRAATVNTLKPCILAPKFVYLGAFTFSRPHSSPLLLSGPPLTAAGTMPSAPVRVSPA